MLFTLSCDEKPNPDVTIIDPTGHDLISKNTKIELLADSLTLAEGPLWDSNANQLIFTDVAQNKMFTWNEAGGIRDFIAPSGYTGFAPAFEQGLHGANGLTFDNNGNILVCQHGDRRIALLKTPFSNQSVFTTVVDSYEGKRFNSPNDIAVAKNGDIYFTDPPYGFFNRKTNSFDNRYRELDFNGVYKYTTEGMLYLISDQMSLPNGIALSNDEKFLYVNNAGSQRPVIMRYDTTDFSSELFFDGTELRKKYKGGFDGLKVHSTGTIFTTGPNGILIISPKGTLLARINFNKGVTNCAFNEEESYLYVTAFDTLHRIKLKN